MKIRYKGPLVAPIAKGQEVAQLVITTGDTPPQIVPLVAGEAVGKAGFFGRIWLGLKSAHRHGVTMRGKFISLEGGEGAGKSTQVQRARGCAEGTRASRCRHARARRQRRRGEDS